MAVEVFSSPYGSVLSPRRAELGDAFDERNETVAHAAENAQFVDRIMTNTFGARHFLREGGLGDFRREIDKQVGFVEEALDGRDLKRGFFLGPQAVDCYDGDTHPTLAEARDFHSDQLSGLEGHDGLPWIETCPTIADAQGAALAAKLAGREVLISFVVLPGGILRSGETINDAIAACDSVGGGFVKGYGVNCCSMKAVEHALLLDNTNRIIAVYPNSSDEDPAGLESACCEVQVQNMANRVQDLATLTLNYPQLQILGGCCGFTPKDVRRLCSLLRSKSALNILNVLQAAGVLTPGK